MGCSISSSSAYGVYKFNISYRITGPISQLVIVYLIVLVSYQFVSQKITPQNCYKLT
jgi:hypothetical protein